MASFYVKVRSKEGDFREIKLGPNQSVDIRDEVDEAKELATIKALGEGLAQDIELRIHEPSQTIRVVRPGGKSLPSERLADRQEHLAREFGWPQPRTEVRFRSGLFREPSREPKITAVNLTDEDGLVASVVWKDE